MVLTVVWVVRFGTGAGTGQFGTRLLDVVAAVAGQKEQPQVAARAALALRHRLRTHRRLGQRLQVKKKQTPKAYENQ